MYSRDGADKEKTEMANYNLTLFEASKAAIQDPKHEEAAHLTAVPGAASNVSVLNEY